MGLQSTQTHRRVVVDTPERMPAEKRFVMQVFKAKDETAPPRLSFVLIVDVNVNLSGGEARNIWLSLISTLPPLSN